MDDRLVRGFISGVIGGLVQSAVKVALYALHWATLLWLDFASVLTQGELPRKLLLKVAHALVMLGWTGTLGVALAYLISLTGESHYRFKGVWFGFVTWFAIYIVVHLYKVPQLVHIPAKTAFSDAVTGMLWGWVTAEALRYLEKRAVKARS